MRTVLNRSTGRAALILASAGMVGSVAFPVVPAMARSAAGHHPRDLAARHEAATTGRSEIQRDPTVRLGPAVAYVRGKNGVVHRIR